ncbi:hypothetical protein CYMTET_48926 [Cymbomonas tetramitiformis]|uniref:3'(2'),5'-bisphosphate nucleotidase 1 n=1 Tax=Cymbomonas tetramitiformis TaxID=36881 RepID=A0AAE0BRD1_9CHLO|nr:hypothetical protein CYMTET_48926 [Cymbomonas tetramitiformis]
MRVVRRAIRSVRANADTQIDVSRVVSACVELAERAGHVIRNVAASGEKGAVDKGGAFDIDGTYIADVQTKADRLVEDLVTWHIRACLPGLPLVAEEAAGGALQIEPDIKDEALSEHLEPLPLDQLEHFPWPRELQAVPAERIVLYVDPLDGTGEFNNGNLEASTTLFGVAVDGRPVAGVIHQPFFRNPSGEIVGRTVWGAVGVGVFGLLLTVPTPGQNSLPPSRAPARDGGLVVGTNRVRRDTRIDVALDALRALGPNMDVVRQSASGFHSLMLLEGVTDVWVLTRGGTKRWDTCAAEALLVSSGGRLSDAIGRRYEYRAKSDSSMGVPFENVHGVIASRDGRMHNTFVQTVSVSIAPWPLE